MDAIIEMMKRYSVPLTRDSYLPIAYIGNPPDELDAEGEANLPERFQIWNDEPEEE